MFTLWTSSLLSISSIEEVNLAKPRLPHWRSGPSFRFYIKATSMTLYHQQLSQSSLKESVFSSTNLVSAKCSLEDGSRASPYFQVSSLHRSLQFAFLHRQRTRHITSVGEKKLNFVMLVTFFKFFPPPVKSTLDLLLWAFLVSEPSLISVSIF